MESICLQITKSFRINCMPVEAQVATREVRMQAPRLMTLDEQHQLGSASWECLDQDFA
jgi:hypothetical protein